MNEIRRPILDKMQGIAIDGSVKPLENLEIDVERAIKLSDVFEKILISEESFDPYLIYAATPKLEKAADSIKRLQSECIKTIKNTSGYILQEKNVSIRRT